MFDFVDKKILITGGSGFLAQALIKFLIEQKKVRPNNILCVARNEGKLLETKQKFGVEILTGDIADRGFVERAMRNQQQIFHLAGFKHVPLGEIQAQECINTNIIGSKNILDASLYSQPEFVLGISTDKAYNPINCYGMSKRLMEYLFLQYENTKGDLKTQYRVARYGNVIGSTGSVLQVWKMAKEQNKPIQLTDPEMTRFFFSVDDAVETVMQCLATSCDAKPFIPHMQAVKLGELAKVFAVDHPIEIIGKRPGEKMNEGMADGYTSDSVELMKPFEIRAKLIELKLL